MNRDKAYILGKGAAYGSKLALEDRAIVRSHPSWEEQYFVGYAVGMREQRDRRIEAHTNGS